MNVIFLDFEGVLITLREIMASAYALPYDKVEKRVALLAEICKEYNCKVVIEACEKVFIDEETMEIIPKATFVRFVFDLFKKYGIECIGRTPSVERKFKCGSVLGAWKEDEIRLYLLRHPEIEHYCVIDDDDTASIYHWEVSDLDKVRDHLVKTEYYFEDETKAGLLPSHKEEVGKVLKKDNEINKLVRRWGHKKEL